MARADDEFLTTAKARFKLAREADQDQRDRELADLKAFDGQIWTDQQLKDRGAQPAIGKLPPSDARPSLNIPLIQEPIKNVINVAKGSELNVELVVADDFGAGVSTVENDEIELR